MKNCKISYSSVYWKWRNIFIYYLANSILTYSIFSVFCRKSRKILDELLLKYGIEKNVSDYIFFCKYLETRAIKRPAINFFIICERNFVKYLKLDKNVQTVQNLLKIRKYSSILQLYSHVPFCLNFWKSTFRLNFIHSFSYIISHILPKWYCNVLKL